MMTPIQGMNVSPASVRLMGAECVPRAKGQTSPVILFGSQAPSDSFENLQIPRSWPEALKTLFRQPVQDIDLSPFKIPVGDFAQAVTPITDPNTGRPNLIAMFKTRAGGINFDWGFIHRIGKRQEGDQVVADPNAPSGAVHALTIVKDKDGKEYVHFVVEKRPPFGAKPILQLPAGIMDKPDVSLLKLGMAEVHEETPFKPVGARVLKGEPVPTSPGATTEQKGFVVVRALYDKEKAAKDYREGAELFITEKGRNIPLADFLDKQKFDAWVSQWEAEGIKVALDVFAVRGMIQ